MKKLFDKINTQLHENETYVIAIDGRSGAGKSTFADQLSVRYGGAVVRMDHFFLPLALRTPGRVNVHYERFLIEVVPYIKKRESFSYRLFDCTRMDFHGIRKVDLQTLVIVEGAYSLLPMWDEIYDLRIFYDIDEEEQKERIISRNGTAGYQKFKDQWIPMEEKYFKEYKVRERSDEIIRIDNLNK